MATVILVDLYGIRLYAPDHIDPDDEDATAAFVASREGRQQIKEAVRDGGWESACDTHAYTEEL